MHSSCFHCLAMALAVVLALGCGSGSKSATGKPSRVATAAPSPPPPPPIPGGSQTSTAPVSTAAATAAASDIPLWVGKRRDEPFDVKAFLASRAAPADNAAPLYERGLALISGAYGSAEAEALEEQIRKLADVEKLGSGEASMEEVERVLAASAEALRQIDAAQAKPQCVFVTGLTADTLLPHAQAAHALSQFAILQLHHAKHAGDPRAVENAARRCLRLSRDLRLRGFSVCQLVSVGMDGQLYSAIERLTLADPNLVPEQCDRLIALLIEHEKQGLDRFDEGMKMDYIMARCSIDDLQTGRLTLAQLYEYQGIERNDLSGPVPMNYDAEIAACNVLYAILLASGHSPRKGEELGEYQAEMGRLRIEWNSFLAKLKNVPPASRSTMVNDMPAMQFNLWTAVSGAFRAATCRIAAHSAGVQTLIALRRYELVHGTLPPTLEAAAAETALKTVPIDPYSGQPLRFATVAGKPTVYSVGKDLKDDGGLIDWKFGTQPGDYLFVLPDGVVSQFGPERTDLGRVN